MAETINLTFINVSDDSEMDVEVSADMTREELVENLIQVEFIPPLSNENEEYGLTIKGKGELGEGQTLADLGVQAGDRIRIAVVQRGGTAPLPNRF
ncbi:MAG: EsaB/YukD family protein [candidate division KSB1 bacterium]|nr:EsaB/YukD family protein [candidate division KSB1 bacterium]MDZ7272854.1 EsaB/YukD family protein [candidate division KSB1 bacterium]MDZ7284123.1 EsaB/YukD family protein [candidate division KSB1 bacterium]MDZ7297479.1 EsaB/YukD family protein [candidate division KSB1 bacterium]MDZ7305615.1 EsaB/YukD family protein [candidate division KSB1 bacterium]